MTKRAWIIALAVMAAVFIGGVAWASIPGADGVIHGCYKANNPAQGAVIVVDSEASCPNGYIPLNWNQTGPQGPSGVSGYEIIENTHPLQVGIIYTAIEVDVSCPEGKRVLGGGAAAPQETDGSMWVVVRSRHNAGPGWHAKVIRMQTAPSTGGEPVRVWAICALVS